MKNLHGLQAFVEAAELGSLTAAAQRLNLTPAAVSKSVARLEAELGVRLFNRSTRRLRLTHEGETFRVRARSALREVDEAIQSVTHAARTPVGRVRISVGMAFGRRWVLPALPAITAAHPGLAIDVDLDNRPVDLVAEGFDIAIRGGVIEDSNLVARRVAALPVVLLASPAYLAAAGVPASPEALAGHRCAVLRIEGRPPYTWSFLRSGRRRIEWTPAAALTTTDPETLLDLALAGAGIVQAGLHHALPWLRQGALKLLMPEQHDPGRREIVIHYPHRQHLAPRVRVVVDALLDHLKGAQDLHRTLPEIVAGHPDWVARDAGRPLAGRRESPVGTSRPRPAPGAKTQEVEGARVTRRGRRNHPTISVARRS